MDLYRETFTLTKGTVAELCAATQDAAGRHTDVLGVGADTMPGLYWVIVRQKFAFLADIPAGAPLTLRTWMGPGRHDLFPRHYAVYDAAGTLLCRGAAVWALLDVNTRAFGKAPRAMYDAPTRAEDDQLPRIAPLRGPKEGQQAAFTVLPDYIDKNGHMNNTRYFDAVFAALPAPAGTLREVQVDYIAEALLDERVDLLWQEADGERTIVGRKDDKDCFRMKLTYEA